MRRIYTILHLYLLVAISLHLLWLISKTTKRPTTSEFLQLFRTSAEFFQSAFFAILYQALTDAPHSLCLAVASLIAFRLLPNVCLSPRQCNNIQTGGYSYKLSRIGSQRNL